MILLLGLDLKKSRDAFSSQVLYWFIFKVGLARWRMHPILFYS